jgi:SAM-dependent methyltransferase
MGYQYAIANGFNAVVLLHSDGQYAFEHLNQMIQPVLNGEAEAVFGSRMVHRPAALKSRVPLYKWVGNQILTFIQNRIMKSHLSEFHTGYRCYSVAALKSMPFDYNSDYFDFDADIIIQLLDTAKRIKEVPIPTFYEDVSGVNWFKFTVRAVYSCVLSKLNRMGLYYHSKFDYEPPSNYYYRPKFGYASSHQFAFDEIRPGMTVLDVGSGPGFMAERLVTKGVRTASIDRQIRMEARNNSWKCVETDIEQYDFAEDFGKVDCIMLLDIIEHLKAPERLLQLLRQRFSRYAPQVIITTGNVAFLPLRISLLFNRFNYGKRGILDMDHTRLFTFLSLSRMLKINGYEIIGKHGIPAPFPLALGDGWLARLLLFINSALIFVSKSLFSYQIAVVARPLFTLEHLLEDARKAKGKKVSGSDFEEGKTK